MAKSKWERSPAEKKADMRDLSPLKLTAKDAEFLNKVKLAAVKADERSRQGKSGVAYYPIATLKKLERLAGRSEERLRAWDTQREEYKMRYPVSTQLIYNELRFIRLRIKAGKEQSNG